VGVKVKSSQQHLIFIPDVLANVVFLSSRVVRPVTKHLVS